VRTAASDRAAVVDEWGQLDAELARLDATTSYKSKERRKESLRETILSWHDKLPGDKEAIEHGTAYDVHITARDHQRVVSIAGKQKLRKLWGVTKFFEMCVIALKQLPDPKDSAGAYTVNDRTGPRHLKALPVVAKAA